MTQINPSGHIPKPIESLHSHHALHIELSNQEQKMLQQLHNIDDRSDPRAWSQAVRAYGSVLNKDLKESSKALNCFSAPKLADYFKTCLMAETDAEVLDGLCSSAPYCIFFAEKGKPGSGSPHEFFIIKGDPDSKTPYGFQKFYYLAEGDTKFTSFDPERDKGSPIMGKITKALSDKNYNILLTRESTPSALNNLKLSRDAVEKGKFYQEKQTQGQCGIHAVNAFMGERYITPEDLTEFNLSYMSGDLAQTSVALLSGDLEDYSPGSAISLANSEEGNDPELLTQFLQQKGLEREDFRLKGIDVREFAKQEVREGIRFVQKLESDANIDRMIVGSGGHFVAFRRDTGGKWVCIDSLKFDGDEPQVFQKPSERVQSIGEQKFFIIANMNE